MEADRNIITELDRVKRLMGSLRDPLSLDALKGYARDLENSLRFPRHQSPELLKI